MPTTEITTAQDFIFDNMHIRIWLGEDGTIWYCAKDVAVALGYRRKCHGTGHRIFRTVGTAGRHGCR